jgi:hypothetical protein
MGILIKTVSVKKYYKFISNFIIIISVNINNLLIPISPKDYVMHLLTIEIYIGNFS